MDKVDIVLEKILLKRGFILSKQMETAKAEVSPRPLSIRLLEKNLISRDKLEELQKEARDLAPYLRDNSEVSSPRIGEILVASNVVTQEQMNAALHKQNKIKASGQEVLVGEILERNGYVNQQQLQEALQKQGKTIMTCSQCRSSCNKKDVKAGMNYPCPSCGAPLEERPLAPENISEEKATPEKKKEIPAHIRETAENPLVQFGNYIIVKEISKAPFGTIFHGWQKEKKQEVGIIFLDKKETQKSSATFIQAQRELLSKGYPNPGLLEVGEHEGKNYMSMTLED